MNLPWGGGLLWPTLTFVAIFSVYGRERENGAGESKGGWEVGCVGRGKSDPGVHCWSLLFRSTCFVIVYFCVMLFKVIINKYSTGSITEVKNQRKAGKSFNSPTRVYFLIFKEETETQIII